MVAFPVGPCLLLLGTVQRASWPRPGQFRLIFGDSVDFGMAAQQCHDHGHRVETCPTNRFGLGASSRCLFCWGNQSRVPLTVMYFFYGVSLTAPYFPATYATHGLMGVPPEPRERLDMLIRRAAAEHGPHISDVVLSSNLWDVARIVYPATRKKFFAAFGSVVLRGRPASSVADLPLVRKWLEGWAENATEVVAHVRRTIRDVMHEDVPIVWKTALPPVVRNAFRGWSPTGTVLINGATLPTMRSLNIPVVDVAACCKEAPSGCPQTGGLDKAAFGKSNDGLHPNAVGYRVFFRCLEQALPPTNGALATAVEVQRRKQRVLLHGTAEDAL